MCFVEFIYWLTFYFFFLLLLVHHVVAWIGISLETKINGKWLATVKWIAEYQQLTKISVFEFHFHIEIEFEPFGLPSRNSVHRIRLKLMRATWRRHRSSSCRLSIRNLRQLISFNYDSTPSTTYGRNLWDGFCIVCNLKWIASKRVSIHFMESN